MILMMLLDAMIMGICLVHKKRGREKARMCEKMRCNEVLSAKRVVVYAEINAQMRLFLPPNKINQYWPKKEIIQMRFPELTREKSEWLYVKIRIYVKFIFV